MVLSCLPAAVLKQQDHPGWEPVSVLGGCWGCPGPRSAPLPGAGLRLSPVPTPWGLGAGTAQLLGSEQALGRGKARQRWRCLPGGRAGRRLGRRLQTEAAESLVPLRGAALRGHSCFQPACGVFAAQRRHSLTPASSGALLTRIFALRPPLPGHSGSSAHCPERDSRVISALGGPLRWLRDAPMSFQNRHAFHPPAPAFP